MKTPGTEKSESGWQLHWMRLILRFKEKTIGRDIGSKSGKYA